MPSIKFHDIEAVLFFIYLFFFFVLRTDIILKTRSTLWLTVIFSAKIFYQVSCKLNQN